jgi:hypothetical protein
LKARGAAAVGSTCHPGVKSVLREEARAVHSAFRKGLASRSGTL